jgi:hypothetical protein
MKKHFFILFIITLLTSCISTKQFSSYVEPVFQKNQAATSAESIAFDFSGLQDNQTPIAMTKLKSQFIPAILFWQWNSTMECEIDPQILGQSFQEDFIQIADSLNLSDKMQGRKLEIKLEEIPNSFIYTNKGRVIILLVAYTMSGLEAIFPEDQNLIITYKLTENEATIKEGKITAITQDKPVKNIWKSAKNFTRVYLNQFKQNNRNMTREIIEKLLTEI